jgi:hypothetical protein
MQKEEFVNVSVAWWLLENDPGLLITQARDQLGMDLGWDREWYANENRVTELYNLIENNQQRLLTELDDAIDETKRVEWLVEVRELLAPAPAEAPNKAHEAETPEAEAQEHGAQASEAQPTAGVEAGGTWDDNWQMLTRVGADNAYQFAFSDDRRTVRPGATWMSQEEATTAKQTPAANEPAAASEPAAAAGEGAAAASAPAAAAPAAAAVTWDPQWGMFLRYADDKYEYALSDLLADAPGIDTPAGQPDGKWHATMEEATNARQAVAELKNTFSDLVADPQVPISEEDLQAALQDPNFQQNLAAADAALEAELAELESES